MALELFRHNEEAYKAVVSMLAERNKAAVVHPPEQEKVLSVLNSAMTTPIR